MGIDDIDFPPTYTGGSTSGGGSDFDDDWAVLELETTWGLAGYLRASVMTLSAASDAVIASLGRVHNLAYPGYVPYCTPAGGYYLTYNEEPEEVAGVLTKSLRLWLDGTLGHSGGPIFYCPADDPWFCAPGEAGYVIAIWAGWNSVVDRVVGPKVPYHRAAMMAFIND